MHALQQGLWATWKLTNWFSPICSISELKTWPIAELGGWTFAWLDWFRDWLWGWFCEWFWGPFLSRYWLGIWGSPGLLLALGSGGVAKLFGGVQVVKGPPACLFLRKYEVGLWWNMWTSSTNGSSLSIGPLSTESKSWAKVYSLHTSCTSSLLTGRGSTSGLLQSLRRNSAWLTTRQEESYGSEGMRCLQPALSTAFCTSTWNILAVV